MLVVMTMCAAFAQDSVVWDFDVSAPNWQVTTGSAALAVPAAPWDGAALAITPVPGWEGYGLESALVLADNDDGSWLVTHTTLTWMGATDLGVGQGTLMWALGPAGELPDASASGVGWVDAGWTAQEMVGLDPICGDSARLELLTAGDAPATPNGGRIYLDAFTFTGEVCPMFVDGDGDARCPQGVDADGDGTCVDGGEAWLPGETADCDDAVVGPSCLTLSATRNSGLSATLLAGEGLAGETVTFVWSNSKGTTCPASLGGVCLGLTRPRSVGQAVVGANGVAATTVNVPTSGWLQASIARPGLASDVSPVIAVP